MKLFWMLIMISLIPVGLNGQTNCFEFNDYNSSQVWIKKIIKLDKEAQRDSALQRIKCERNMGEQIVKYPLICIFGGLIVHKIPDYRDSLLNQINSNDYELIASNCEMEGVYPEKCNLGFLLVGGLEKPIINKTRNLAVKKIERKKGRLSFNIETLKSGDYVLRIENFGDEDNYQNTKKYLKKGNNKIDLRVDEELKLISVFDNDNKLVLIK